MKDLLNDKPISHPPLFDVKLTNIPDKGLQYVAKVLVKENIAVVVEPVKDPVELRSHVRSLTKIFNRLRKMMKEYEAKMDQDPDRYDEKYPHLDPEEIKKNLLKQQEEAPRIILP